jgi:hypothetical protein
LADTLRLRFGGAYFFVYGEGSNKEIVMQKELIAVYKTEDGKTWLTEEEALRHEQKVHDQKIRVDWKFGLAKATATHTNLTSDEEIKRRCQGDGVLEFIFQNRKAIFNYMMKREVLGE